MHTCIIADSHRIFREALSDYIRNSGYDIDVFQSSDRYGVFDSIVNGDNVLVLVEDGILNSEEILTLSQKYEQAKFAVLSSDSTGEKMMGIGGCLNGIFNKSLSCKEMLSGILDIFAGKNYFPKFIGAEEDKNLTYLRASRSDFALTSREQEVLSYLVKGKSNKEIARELKLQVVTIKLHVRGICRKMKVQNRTQAALIAKEYGWG